MAIEVVMPRLGWTMEVGRVVAWLKADGDPVEAGEPLFAVESDKSVTDIEALDSGVLRLPPEGVVGVELPVGATLAYITRDGESAPFAAAAGATWLPAAPVPVVAATTSAANGRGARRTASPRARKLAGDLGIDWTVLPGGGAGGRVREREVRAAAAGRTSPSSVPAPGPAPRAAPAVRRLADERGVALGVVSPSGPAGRITRLDVDRAAPSGSAAAHAEAATPHLAPISGARAIVFQRMTEAARTVAPVTLHHPADATELCRLRAELRADGGDTAPAPTYDDLFIRLAALALRRHPALNASVAGGRIVRHERVSVAFAVDAGEGLFAPVVHDADRKSVYAIAAETRALVAAARAGALAPDDGRGSTFTVTNLGMHGIEAFTPIVNLPNAAVLGVGAIRPTPVVTDETAGTVAVRRMMTLSLTFDHRIVDGAPAARFLHDLAGSVERPLRWLLS